MPHVLVIEDDAAVSHLIDAYARAVGWTVTVAAEGTTGLQVVRTEAIDIVVLDVLLPDQSGWDVLEAIRAESAVYVILLTALDSEVDRIFGLGRGADDYVVKPFSPGELLARCQALLRRPRDIPAAEDSESAGLVIDPVRFAVHCDGQPITLTALEFRLLTVLSGHPGRVFSREELMQTALGFDYAGYDRIIDVHVGHLRHKLGDNPASPRYIETVRGVGYRFVAQNP